MTHCHAYALDVIVKLYLKEFSSNCTSCQFNTKAKNISSSDTYWRLRQDLLHDSPTQMCIHKARQLVIQCSVSVFFKNIRVSIGLKHNPSIRNLKDGERDKYDRLYLRIVCSNKLAGCMGMGIIF